MAQLERQPARRARTGLQSMVAQNLSDKIDQMRAEIGEVREMLAQLPQRDEIVTRDVYASDKHGFDQRLRSLEERPTNARANVNVTSQVVIAMFALGALLLSLATHVSLH